MRSGGRDDRGSGQGAAWLVDPAEPPPALVAAGAIRETRRRGREAICAGGAPHPETQGMTTDQLMELLRLDVAQR